MHGYLLRAFQKRVVLDYNVSVRLSLADVKQLVLEAEEFVAAAQKYLG